MIQIIFPNIMCDMDPNKILVNDEQGVISVKMKQWGQQLQLPQGIFSLHVYILNVTSRVVSDRQSRYLFCWGAMKLSQGAKGCWMCSTKQEVKKNPNSDLSHCSEPSHLLAYFCFLFNVGKSSSLSTYPHIITLSTCQLVSYVCRMLY